MCELPEVMSVDIGVGIAIVSHAVLYIAIESADMKAVNNRPSKTGMACKHWQAGPTAAPPGAISSSDGLAIAIAPRQE
jgi:hypothetical protein